MHYSSSGDRYRDYIDDSTSHKLKNAYWSTRQAVIRKLGKEEDRHIAFCDAELDAKLELFKSIKSTCQDLSACVDAYLRCIFVLSQIENDTGRFLNSRSFQDNTRAGKMLSAVGKALSQSAKQRLILQNPLSRLEQEVQTFRTRAIGDTATTISRMETARTQYRGALMWMKNVSEELDPDMYKKLDKFRRVQTQVKKSKVIFDRLKLASMQKVDLLAASRCNMLSHVLAAYQDTLLQFWEITARTMTTVSNSFKGYQYYEFALLKDLTVESRKLAEQTSQIFGGGENQADDEVTRPVEALWEEGKEATEDGHESESNLAGSPQTQNSQLPEAQHDKDFDNLLSLGEPLGSKENNNNNNSNKEEEEERDLDDLLFSSLSQDKEADIFKSFEVPSAEGSKSVEESDFLKDILSLDQAPPTLFDVPTSPQKAFDSGGDALFQVNWDSQLFDVFHSAGPSLPPQGQPATPVDSASGPQASTGRRPPASALTKTAKSSKKPDPADVEAWMNFFADLTPMGNPDQQSTQQGHVLDT